MSTDFDNPTDAEIAALLTAKYGLPGTRGWGPQLRDHFGMYTPDDFYEAVVAKLVDEQTDWLDVGCGRDLFPSNPTTARALSRRCRLLVGVDPSDNIDRNQFVHRRVKVSIEQFESDKKFDLVTLRMVAEHVAQPSAVASVLQRCVQPGGRVVIYTVNKRSIIATISSLIPFRLHHPIKRMLWGTEAEDTFPVRYLMNTRDELARVMASAGFVEDSFRYLDDCSTFSKWRSLHAFELRCWKAIHRAGLRYPETCLLGIYRSASADGP